MITNKLLLKAFFITLPIILNKIFITEITKIQNKKLLKIFLRLLSFLELIRILYLVLSQKFNLKTDLPLQLCYLIIFIIIIELINHKDYLLDYIITSSIFFGIVAIILYPHTIPKLLILIGYLYHSSMIFLGMTFFSKKYILKKENTIKITLILLIQIFILSIINNLLNSNYGFLKIIFNPEIKINDPFLSFYYTPILSFKSLNYYILIIKKTLSIYYTPVLISIMYINYKIIIQIWFYIKNKKTNKQT